MADPHRLTREGGGAASSLPALLTEAERVAGSLAAGLHGRRRPGAGETFWQYRDYAPGDPAALIDWRQSARSGSRLFVRQTEWETAASVHLWCGGADGFDWGSAGLTKKWRALVAAAALGVLLTRAGERVGAMDAPAAGGRAAVTGLAERLLAAREEALPPLPPRGATHLLLVSDFHAPMDALSDRLRAYAATGRPVFLVQVFDPAEADFPYGGRTMFRSPSGAQRHDAGDAGALAPAYKKARQAHFAALGDLCAGYGWPFFTHGTDAPLTPTLSALHAALSGGRGR